MRERLGLSFDNAHSVHQIVDSIPPTAGAWYKKNLSFHDRPEEVYPVRHRDIIQAIRSLWGDPTLSQYLVYKPKKIFSGADKRQRIYSEMWTGQWWQAIQVSYCQLYILYAILLGCSLGLAAQKCR